MTLQRLEPFIDGKTVAITGKATTLISPVDLTPSAELTEADAACVLRATQSAHAAYIANRKSSLAQRIQWLNAAAALVEKAAARHLGYIENLARKAGVPFKATHRTDEYPASAILAAAKKEKCDLIYIASHGHAGFRKTLLGSQTTKVLANSTIPVLVHR